MQISGVATSMMLLASLASSAPSAIMHAEETQHSSLAVRELKNNLCTVQASGALWIYKLRSENVPLSKIDDFCGTWWDKLADFSSCVTSGTNSCGSLGSSVDDIEPGTYGKRGSEYADNHGGVKIEFQVGAGCNHGCVQSAWWETQKNEYGEMVC